MRRTIGLRCPEGKRLAQSVHRRQFLSLLLSHFLVLIPETPVDVLERVYFLPHYF